MDANNYEVFEEHLRHLEEQLVTLTIENQNLVSELQGYKNKESLGRLKTEIDIERTRYKRLEDKYKQLQVDYDNQSVHSSDSVQGWVDVSIKTGKGKKVKQSQEYESPKSKRFERLWKRIIESIYTFVDDFTVEPEIQSENQEEPPLTVKQLKENLNRFKTDLKPFLDTAAGIQQLLAWRTPSYTLLMFLVYLVSVWNGCLMSVILFCLFFRMIISYLNYLGFQVKFNFFQPVEELKSKEDDNLGLSDKFNLVILVARKVQNGLGTAADSLEKIQSLLSWRTPVTRKLFTMLTIGFIFSLTTSISDYSHYIGISMGIKVFIINYFYNKYPRLKKKYNSSYKTWQQLPTTAQYEKHFVKSEINQYLLTDKSSEDTEAPSESKKIKDTDKEFCQLFSLPNSECPVIGWQGGKRCSLINKDKSVLSAFKNGRLYLTRSFLCFERTRTPSKKNIVIPLADITALAKAKPYSILPGSGMSIEVKVVGDKVFMFGAIVYRDEVYDSILQAGLDQLLPWATGVSSNNSASANLSLRRRSASKITNFTWATDYKDAD